MYNLLLLNIYLLHIGYLNNKQSLVLSNSIKLEGSNTIDFQLINGYKEYFGYLY